MRNSTYTVNVTPSQKDETDSLEKLEFIIKKYI